METEVKRGVGINMAIYNGGRIPTLESPAEWVSEDAPGSLLKAFEGPTTNNQGLTTLPIAEDTNFHSEGHVGGCFCPG